MCPSGFLRRLRFRYVLLPYSDVDAGGGLDDLTDKKTDNDQPQKGRTACQAHCVRAQGQGERDVG